MQPTAQPTIPAYLLARREAILDNWRTVCGQDPALRTVSALSREEFNDRIPAVMNILTERLRGEKESADPVLLASEHGLHRWHKGYSLPELLNEVGHLFQCLANELPTYHDLFVQIDSQSLMRTYREIIRLSHETVAGSVARYDELEQIAAGSRVDTLQIALNQLNELARQRSDVLRTSSHDLHSSLGIIQGASFMLDLDHQNPEQRNQLVDMLNRNLTSVQSLLRDLMSLARLDAGQESINSKSLDVSTLLNELVRDAQPLATQRGVALLADGPAGMIVECDLIKTQQIIDHLLANALKNTASGIISLSWAKEDNYRWTVSVQRSGSDLPSGIPTILLENLAPTHDSTATLKSKFDSSISPHTLGGTAPTVPDAGGGDIGLHLVKRLCEVLDASMDIESDYEAGTLIRIRFPVSYSDSLKK